MGIYEGVERWRGKVVRKEYVFLSIKPKRLEADDSKMGGGRI